MVQLLRALATLAENWVPSTQVRQFTTAPNAKGSDPLFWPPQALCTWGEPTFMPKLKINLTLLFEDRVSLY